MKAVIAKSLYWLSIFSDHSEGTFASSKQAERERLLKERTMGANIMGSSSNMYVPIQHPNAGTRYTSTATPTIDPYTNDYRWSEQKPSLAKPAFTLEEIETAKNLITELSDK